MNPVFCHVTMFLYLKDTTSWHN